MRKKPTEANTNPAAKSTVSGASARGGGPESPQMLMWVMSDRALPRSFRTIQGSGVHTFRPVNAQGSRAS